MTTMKLLYWQCLYIVWLSLPYLSFSQTFFAIEDQLSHTEANVECNNDSTHIRGQLASVHSTVEDSEVHDVCLTTRSGPGNIPACWIGLFTLDGIEWQWYDESSLDYTDWGQNGPSVNQIPSCVIKQTTELWYPNPCSSKYPFAAVCRSCGEETEFCCAAFTDKCNNNNLECIDNRCIVAPTNQPTTSPLTNQPTYAPTTMCSALDIDAYLNDCSADYNVLISNVNLLNSDMKTANTSITSNKITIDNLIYEVHNNSNKITELKSVFSVLQTQITSNNADVQDAISGLEVIDAHLHENDMDITDIEFKIASLSINISKLAAIDVNIESQIALIQLQIDDINEKLELCPPCKGKRKGKGKEKKEYKAISEPMFADLEGDNKGDYIGSFFHKYSEQIIYAFVALTLMNLFLICAVLVSCNSQRKHNSIKLRNYDSGTE